MPNDADDANETFGELLDKSTSTISHPRTVLPPKGGVEETIKVSRCSLFGVFLVSFIMNVEYAILMPTVWRYVESLHGTQIALGIILAAFSLSRSLFFPVIGKWCENRGYREPFLFTLLIGAAGNFIYGVAGYMDLLVFLALGRFIAGIGAANVPMTVSYVARSCSEKSRVTMMSLLNAINILGLVLGPVLNFMFRDTEGRFGLFILNESTMAGYVMMTGNIICFLLFAVSFEDIGVNTGVSAYSASVAATRVAGVEDGHSALNTPFLTKARPALSNASSGLGINTGNNNFNNDEVDGAQSYHTSRSASTGSRSSPRLIDAKAHLEDNSSLPLRNTGNDLPDATPDQDGDDMCDNSTCGISILLRNGSLALMIIKFSIGCELSSIETAITPITQAAFQFSSFENSILFALIALVVLGGVLLTVLLTRMHFSERGILLISISWMTVGAVVATVVNSGKSTDIHLAWFIFAGFMLLSGIPMVNAASTTLASRIISQSQSASDYNIISQLVMGFARVIGPLGTGFLLSWSDQLGGVYWPLYAALSLFVVLCVIAVAFSWSLLSLPPSASSHASSSDSEATNDDHDGSTAHLSLADQLLQGIDDDDLLHGNHTMEDNSRKWAVQPGTSVGSMPKQGSSPLAHHSSGASPRQSAPMSFGHTHSTGSHTGSYSHGSKSSPSNTFGSPPSRNNPYMPASSGKTITNPYLPQGSSPSQIPSRSFAHGGGSMPMGHSPHPYGAGSMLGAGSFRNNNRMNFIDAPGGAGSFTNMSPSHQSWSGAANSPPTGYIPERRSNNLSFSQYDRSNSSLSNQAGFTPPHHKP